MTTPVEDMLAKMEPKVLAAFEKAYQPPPYKQGVCSRCGTKPADALTHNAWHKAQAKQMWCLATLGTLPHLLLEP